MCSTQWDEPVRPGTSFREPTLYHSQWLMIGAVWISLSITTKPLSNVVFVMEFCIFPLHLSMAFMIGYNSIRQVEFFSSSR
jgi:hypothetical protein